MQELNTWQPKELLEAINHLLEYQNYSLAFQCLENVFQKTEPNTKEYLYAQVLLIDTYLHSGQFQNAINLCQELINSEHQTTQILAQFYLNRVSTDIRITKTKNETASTQIALNQAEAVQLINTGYQALTQKQYLEAIKALEKFCQNASKNTKQYLQAHQWLVKAYQENGQIDDAIALCQKLLLHEYESIRKWARKLLYTELFIDNFTINTLITTSNLELQPQPKVTKTIEEETVTKRFIPKTLNEFKDFCQKHLLPELKTFETRRKQVLFSILISHVIFLTAFTFLLKGYPVVFAYLTENILIIYYGTKNVNIPITFIVLLFNYLILFLILFWLWIMFYSASLETLSRDFKFKISENIFTFVNQDKNLTYIRASLPQDIRDTLYAFQHSQLFQGIIRPNKIRQTDYISGKFKGVNICFSYIRAELEVEHSWTKYFDLTSFASFQEAEIINFDSFGGFIFSCLRLICFLTIILPFTVYIVLLIFRIIKIIPYLFGSILQGKSLDYKKFESEVLKNQLTRTSLVFKGFLFRAKFNKTSQAAIIVQPKLINANPHSLNHLKRQIVKLEDPEFAKYFNVYSDDQLEARYILSPSLMEKLVTLRKQKNRNIYISFIDNMIYIAIEHAVEDDELEPNLFKSMLRFSPLKNYFETLNFVLTTVDELNLDKYIWQD
ncbi:DUF3137 domain-containing protein [Nostoc sp. MS1]|uniref:DUF3137 domain-containing protein n=1 Tax=Nostoc sp. MS1 TaxID=2764711 RepID=UPI001CC4D636|nr:DUF3137 domain-containing protein [Nostoc sp. MS1]BCL36705.1 hypothetical protein NSMS1_31520 [Nostoc sp. MS1]